MRSASFFVLCAWGAVSTASNASSTCDQADGNSLLQTRRVVRAHTQKSANELLRSMQDAASSFTKGSIASMTPDDVNAALATANTALQTMFPAFANQHEVAQQEIQHALGAVQACHHMHGGQESVQLQEAAARATATKDDCEETLEDAVEGEVEACEGQGEDPNCLCNEARTAITDQTALCAVVTELYEAVFCQNHLSCTSFSQCHQLELEQYRLMSQDIQSEMLTRQQEYHTAMQTNCLMDLIMAAMLSSTPIDDARLVACDDVNVDELMLTFPDPPPAPDKCPAARGDHQCEHALVGAISSLRNPHSLAPPPEGQWQLALNIDTDDGHAVNYANAEFWEGETALGGATSELGDALTQDYKNPDAFNAGLVNEVLVVVHNEGEMLGWRRWRATQSHSSLRDYFTASNTCEGGAAHSHTLAGSVQLAAETIDAEQGQLDAHEPLVVNSVSGGRSGSTSELWINAGGGDDFNRLSTTQNPPNNFGWGLGTVYDIGTNGNRLCLGSTMRPQADAQMHVDQVHWGSQGGMGGLIGTDHICNNNGEASCPEGRCSGCPWTVPSGIQYDYAIFVKPTRTTGNDGNGIVSSGGPDGARSIQFIDLGAGAFDSAGEIRNVRYHVSRANVAGQKFQIYRPVSGTTYRLISETAALASTQAGAIVTQELATPLQFQAGDFIGWVHTGQGTFPFRGGGGSVRWRYGIQGVGSDIDFNGAGARIYGYEASFTTQ